MDTFLLELTCKERSILATVEESRKLLHLLSLKYCNLTQLKVSVKATMKALYTGQPMFEMSNRKRSKKRGSDRVRVRVLLSM